MENLRKALDAGWDPVASALAAAETAELSELYAAIRLRLTYHHADLEEAVATAMSIPVEPTGLHPRMNSMLQDFGSALGIAAPSSDPATAWDHYAHDSLRKHL